MGGIGLDLLAQPSDVDGDRRVVAERPAPDLLEQLVAREAPGRDEPTRKRSRSNSRTVRASRRPARVAVCSVASTTRSPSVDRAADRAALTGPPQHRLHPQHQLARAEGLGHVVVGTALEPDHPVGLGAERGQHDRPGRRRPWPGAAGRPRARRCRAASGRARPGRRARPAGPPTPTRRRRTRPRRTRRPAGRSPRPHGPSGRHRPPSPWPRSPPLASSIRRRAATAAPTASVATTSVTITHHPSQ